MSKRNQPILLNSFRKNKYRRINELQDIKNNEKNEINNLNDSSNDENNSDNNSNEIEYDNSGESSNEEQNKSTDENILNSDSSDDDIDEDSVTIQNRSEQPPKPPPEYINIKKEIDTINDLIELGEMYEPDSNKIYNINLRILHNLIIPLTKLKNVIGMDSIKRDIVDFIIYYLQDFQCGCNEMMHTVIQGKPGVGKTMIGRIIGEIYYKMEIIKGNKIVDDKIDMKKELQELFSSMLKVPKNKIRIIDKENRLSGKKEETTKDEDFIFRVVKRSDLIGKYLGHTAAKTQEVIDSCEGGVMFIDEAYSLGNEEGRDSFSKECIDTINQNLSENKKNFLCIIAGYKDALDRCFFAYNEGLRRRFPFVYTIEPYDAKELLEIFKKIVKENGWEFHKDDQMPLKLFEKHHKQFTHYGGDMEQLFFDTRISHSKRVFCLPVSEKKKLREVDIEEGIKTLLKSKVKHKIEEPPFGMYL
jgi:hypothetical protein